jgi:hypothetical protein
MGFLRIAMTGYGCVLYVGEIGKENKDVFEKHWHGKNMNDVWYEGEPEVLEKLLGVDDTLDIDDLCNIEGICFYKKENLDSFIAGKNSSVSVSILQEASGSLIGENAKQYSTADLNFNFKEKIEISPSTNSVAAYHGGYYRGDFDCLFDLDYKFDPEKLILNYEDWGKYGYIITSAKYGKQKADFILNYGDLMEQIDPIFK